MTDQVREKRCATDRKTVIFIAHAKASPGHEQFNRILGKTNHDDWVWAHNVIIVVESDIQ